MCFSLEIDLIASERARARIRSLVDIDEATALLLIDFVSVFFSFLQSLARSSFDRMNLP